MNVKRKASAWTKYFIASAAVLTCSLVYEHFGHGVYSVFMLGAFLVPLIAGALPCLIASKLSHKKRADESGHTAAGMLQLASVVTLTAGSFLKGALDIYGTGNSLLVLYPVVGITLAIAAICAGLRASNTYC